MLLGRVTGEVVATHKSSSHEGLKLLVVQTLELDGTERPGAPLIAVDSVGAGAGDRVLVTLDGWGAMTAVDRFPAPIDCAVLGVVDEVKVEGGDS
ncbi:MAG: ethanolamine utilization protein EutN [Acidobacteria bacterium]|nr:ethanolamine utilization protein EutN [Acidobacteriota bacterium]